MKENSEAECRVTQMSQLAIERDKLLHSPEMEISRSIRRTGRSILAAARSIIQLPGRLWKLARSGRANSATYDIGDLALERRFSVDPQYVYRLTGHLCSPGRPHNSKAAIVSAVFLDVDGNTVGVQQRGFNFSNSNGFYRYLPAGHEATPFSIPLDPPARSSQVDIRIRGWGSPTMLTLEKLLVARADLQENARMAMVEAELSALETSPPETLVIVHSEYPNPEEAEALRKDEDAHVLVIYDVMDQSARSEMHAPGLIPQRLLPKIAKRLARLPAGQRHLYLSRPTMEAVQLANLFRFHGWALATTRHYRGDALPAAAVTRKRYLDELTSKRSA